jgi:rhodanese-related sulfurtransferase
MRIHQHPKVASVCDTLQALTTLADEPVYLLCRSGARSTLAAQSLQAMGFHKVYSVEGGFQAWLDAGYSVNQ